MTAGHNDGFRFAHGVAQFKPFVNWNDRVECPENHQDLLWVGERRHHLRIAMEISSELLMEFRDRYSFLSHYSLSSPGNAFLGGIGEEVGEVPGRQTQTSSANPRLDRGQERPFDRTHADPEDADSLGVQFRTGLDPVNRSAIFQDAVFDHAVQVLKARVLAELFSMNDNGSKSPFGEIIG